MRTIAFLLTCALALPLCAQTERPIETVVSEATVYLEGAQLVRKKNIDLPAGETVLKFTGLSADTDAKSIQVKAVGNITVLSVNHQMDFLGVRQKEAATSALQKQLEAIDKQMEVVNIKLAILTEEYNFLNNNSQLNGKDQALPVAELKEASVFFQTKLTAIKTEELQHHRLLADLNGQRARLQGQLNGLAQTKGDPTAEVVVKVNVKTAGQFGFELTYLVQKAGWFPSYDIRANSVAQPIELTYKANVFQRTGEDWRNVKLAFSSGNPSLGGVAPKLKPYLLDYYLRPPVYTKGNGIFSGKVLDASGQPIIGASVVAQGTTIGTVTDMDGNFSLALPANCTEVNVSFIGYDTKTVNVGSAFANVVLAENNTMLQEVMVLSDESASEALQGRLAGVDIARKSKSAKMESIPLEVTAQHQPTTVAFAIAMPYTIPADGKYYAVEMDRLTLETAFEYYAVPKIDRDAFLMAHVTNWEQHNLLGGEANIYFEGTYMGKTVLDVSQSTDTLTLSLGRDRNIAITRDKSKEFTKRQMLGSRVSETRHWVITVRNQKQQPVNLTLFDQVPVSNQEEIEVSDLMVSGAHLNANTGEAIWKLELKPGESRKTELSYQVKYPKGKSLVVE